MQATEILTSLRSEKPNASSSKAPAIGQQLGYQGKPDNSDQSAAGKARAYFQDPTGQGNWRQRMRAALTTLTSLQSERSGTTGRWQDRQE